MDLTAARQAEHAKYVRAYQQPRYRMKAERRADAVADLKALPPWLEIVNATPGSALKCFPFMPLEDALVGLRVEAAE